MRQLNRVHDIATKVTDWTAIREDFPILRQEVHGKPLIYFDNAATTQKPRAVIEAIARYYEHDNANVHRGLHALSTRATEAYEKSRARVARYIGAASPDEIIFTRGTTESINLVAQAWGGKALRAGDVILLTEMEHHSNLVPWQLIAERTGARLRFVPVNDDGTLALDQLDATPHDGGEAVRVHPRLELVRHDQSGRGPLPQSTRRRRASRSSTPRKARVTCRSMSRNSVAISSPSPATKCVPRPASAHSTAARKFSSNFRPGTAAGK